LPKITQKDSLEPIYYFSRRFRSEDHKAKVFMITTLMIIHAIICAFIVITVLLQFGKGSEAGLMSGGAGDAVFSTGQQGNILAKVTTFLVVAFVVNCLALSKLQSIKHSKSILDGEAPVARPLNSDSAKTEAPVTAPEATATEPATTTPAAN
jgi:preprotein translocase subunit SecG